MMDRQVYPLIGTKYTKKKIDDTKGVIRIRKSKDRQHNGQKKNNTSTKHTHKTKDRVTRTSLETGVNSWAQEG